MTYELIRVVLGLVMILGLIGWGAYEGWRYHNAKRARQRPKAIYLLCPGPVVSKTDGQLHWITAAELAALYRVPMADCLVQTDKTAGHPSHRKLFRLTPRCDGDYNWIS